jgi:hypothetical protein
MSPNESVAAGPSDRWRFLFVVMKPSAILLLTAVLFLGCSQTTDFELQAYAGKRLVSGIETYKHFTGKYPDTLSDLVPKYLFRIHTTNELQSKYAKWEYQVITNGETYRLKYEMGNGEVAYEPTNWTMSVRGSKTIIPANQLEYRPVYPLFNIFLNLLELALMVLTAWIVPRKMPLHWGCYIVYTVAAIVVWLGFLIFTSPWWPEPGIGIAMLGFVCWLVGTSLYIPRIKNRLIPN